MFTLLTNVFVQHAINSKENLRGSVDRRNNQIVVGF